MEKDLMCKQCLKVKLALIADRTVIKMRVSFIKSWVDDEIFRNDSNLNNVVFYYTTKTVNHYTFISCEQLADINQTIANIRESIEYQESILKFANYKYPLL